MSTKKTISKILLGAFWLLAGTGLLVLLVAAIGRKNTQKCSGYTVAIKGDSDHYYVDEKEVIKMISSATGGKVKGQPVSKFNLMKLESFIEDNVWVRDAELYFDNKDLLHINIKEREPLARIFTTANRSFYIDSSLVRMPLSENYSARVPVFTNVPERKYWSAKDSLLMNEIKQTAGFILNDPFWMAQVSQVDVNRNNEFEMLPTIGNHVVRIGNSNDLDKKFHRLFVFYTQVMKKTGFDKYSVIDVSYAGQVVASEKGTTSGSIDSVQLRANVMKLLQKTREAQDQAERDIVEAMNNTSAAPAKKVETPLPVAPVEKPKSAPYKKPAVVQTAIKKTAVPVKPKNQNKVPKAVMPKRNG